MNVDYWGNKNPKCPHCGADFKVWENDRPMSLSYEDDGRSTFDCDRCGKNFVCVTIVRYVFSTAVSEEAADDEEWGPQETREPV